MVACQGDEAKYIVRALQGKLRIGIAMQTVLVGLAHAFATPTPAQIALSKSLQSADEEGKMEVVQDSDDEDEADDRNSEVVKETTGNDNGKVDNIDKLKEKYALTDDEKEDPNSTSGNQKLHDWVGSLSFSAPEESVKLRNASKDSCGGCRVRKLTKEERDECAVIAVKRAFSECPSLDILANTLLKYPIYDIFKYCLLTPGVPVAPMLAKPTKQIAEVLKRLNGLHFTMEYKYDGERAQVHLLSDGSVKIFSRNSEDNSQVIVLWHSGIIFKCS
jgi:DNA ligase-1